MELKSLTVNGTRYDVPDPAEEVEEALNEAKESGEFDGPPYELTEEDKEELVNGVLAALPVWEGGSY